MAEIRIHVGILSCIQASVRNGVSRRRNVTCPQNSTSWSAGAGCFQPAWNAMVQPRWLQGRSQGIDEGYGVLIGQ